MLCPFLESVIRAVRWRCFVHCFEFDFQWWYHSWYHAGVGLFYCYDNMLHRGRGLKFSSLGLYSQNFVLRVLGARAIESSRAGIAAPRADRLSSDSSITSLTQLVMGCVENWSGFWFEVVPVPLAYCSVSTKGPGPLGFPVRGPNRGKLFACPSEMG